MKKLLMLFSLIVFLFCTSKPIKAQTDLQCRVNILEIGKSTFNEMKMLFGNTNSKNLVSSWWDDSADASSFKKSYSLADSEKSRVSKSQIINLYEFEYKEKGLIFNLFDNPNELYSIEITNPEISVLGIKVGDKLNQVISKLGKNDEWTSTRESDYWTLVYEKLNVKFIFLRDKNFKQFPKKLDKKKVVVRIDKFNSNISFTG